MMENSKIKFIICLLNTFLISHTFSQSGWFWQNPLPQGNDLYCFSFPTSNVFFAAGDGGTILKSTNGGLNWFIIHHEQDFYITSISFIDENTGIYSGYFSKIRKTTNGGSSWNEVYVDNQNPIVYSKFTNGLTGYAVSSNKLLKTTNAGDNWFIYSTFSGFISTFYFVNGQTGFASIDSNYSYANLFMTTNNGNNWNKVYTAALYLSEFYFINDMTGFGCAGSFIKSTNGGLNWFTQSNQSGYHLRFPSEFLGYQVLYDYIYKTSNSGINWYPVNITFSIDAENIEITNDSRVFVNGKEGLIMMSSNQGSNWSLYTSKICHDDINSVRFINENTGFICFGDFIMKTVNSGNNWEEIFMSQTNNFVDLYFTNSFTGYALQDCNLYKTTNCGNNWILKYSNNLAMFTSICFIDLDTGYATGVYGHVIKTTNGGENWTNVFTLNSVFYTSIFFTNGNTGYITRRGGEILKTTNGGYNWISNFNMDSSLINSVFFTNSVTGYAAGGRYSDYKGFIIKTTNSGLNWFLCLNREPEILKRIEFVNENTGFAIGERGSFVKTINSGDNWTKSFTGVQKGLNDLDFINSQTGFAVGNKGAIVKTTTGGAPIGIEVINKNIPDKFILYQNFPNPFNPKTTIKYDLPKDGFLTFKVYDVLGKVLYSTIEYNHAGTYIFTFDGTNYASGLYFYRLESGSYVETKKMVLVK